MHEAVTVTRARRAWPEAKGFTINRPKGIQEYTFLRFHGSVRLLVNGEVVTAPPGACIFYNINTPQWFESPEPLVHDWMHMTGAVEETLSAVGLRMDTLYVPANGQFVTAILREMEFEILANPDRNTELPQLKYRELLIKLSRAVSGEYTDGPLKPSVKNHLRQVRSRIFAKLGYDWTVKEMAELAYVSPSRFHTVYRTAFGISPMDELIHARIDTAKNRLDHVRLLLSLLKPLHTAVRLVSHIGDRCLHIQYMIHVIYKNIDRIIAKVIIGLSFFIGWLSRARLLFIYRF